MKQFAIPCYISEKNIEKLLSNWRYITDGVYEIIDSYLPDELLKFTKRSIRSENFKILAQESIPEHIDNYLGTNMENFRGRSTISRYRCSRGLHKKVRAVSKCTRIPMYNLTTAIVNEYLNNMEE